LEADGRVRATAALGAADARLKAIDAAIDQRIAEIHSRCAALRRRLEAAAAVRAAVADAGGTSSVAGLRADLNERRHRLGERTELQAGGSELDGEVEARGIESSSASTESRLARAANREVAAHPAEARQRVVTAVSEVLEAAVRELRGNTAEHAAGARHAAQASAGEIRAAGSRAVQELGGHTGEAEAQITVAAAGAARAIEVAGHDHMQQVDVLEPQLVASLASMKTTVAEQLRAAGATAADEALATAADAVTDVDAAEQASQAALDRAGAEARRQLLAADGRRVPQPGPLATAIAQAAAAITQLRVSASAEFDVVSSVAGARQDSISAALKSAGDHAQSETMRANDDALLRLSAVEQSLRQSLDRGCAEVLLNAAEAEASVRQRAAAALDHQVDESVATLARQRAHSRDEIHSRADQAIASHVSLERDASARISEAARDAADPSIWRGIGRGALTFLKGLAIFIGVVLLVAAVIWVIAAIVGAAIALGEIIAIALVVAGVLMLIGGLILTLIQRFQQAIAMMRGKPWGWWLLLGPWVVVVSVGQLFGVTQILEGLIGHDLVSGDSLDREDRAARITEGVLIVITLGLARIVARALPAPRGFWRPSWWAGRRGAPPGGRPPVIDPNAPPGSEQPAPGPDQPGPGPDQPAPGPDQPAPGPDQPAPGPDQPRPGPDQPAPGPDQPPPGPDRPPPEPVPPVDPWAAVQARHPGLSDAHVAILREVGIDPAMADRVLTGGVQPDALVLRAIDGGPRLVGIMDALVREGVEGRRASRVAELAPALDEIFPGRGILDAVNELATSGRLENPRSLARLLEAINANDQGKISELELAAARARAGHQVQLGAQNRVGGDVVDLTGEEVIQNKDLTTDKEARTVDALDEAANQLAGKGARGQLNPGDPDTEVPPNRPDGTPFTRTARLIIRNPLNDLFHADRAAVETFVRETLAGNRNRGSVDRVEVENGNPGSPFIVVGPF
jgi:hypothetical protein